MRLYIAGPMTGLEDYNYPAFLKAGEDLQAAGYEVLNPARIDEEHARARKRLMEPNTCKVCDDGSKHDWVWYMKQAIIMVCQADGLAVLKGWENSRGARVEVNIASVIELPIATVQTWRGRSKRLKEEHGHDH